VNIRRSLLAACAALTLLAASAAGELRGAADDGGGDSISVADSFDALPVVPSVHVQPPRPVGSVFVDLQFPPARVTTADVFRPPQA